MTYTVSISIVRDKFATRLQQRIWPLLFILWDWQMQTELRLTLLGAPQVWLENKVVQSFRTIKTQALFYYLVVTRRAHTRSALATLLWGDMPERNAHVSLSKSLSNLRSLFPAHLEIDRHFVAFNSRAPYWLDVATLEAGLTAPQGASYADSLNRSLLHDESNLVPLRKVTDLYRGDFLAGFVVNNAPDFDAWQSTEAQRLRQLVLHGLDTLTNRYAAWANWIDAIACCRQMLTLEPWREESHRQLMRLLLASGQRSAALAQYELCVATLQDELAVEPEPETFELYADIVAGRLGVEEAGRAWTRLAPEQTTQQATAPKTHQPPTPPPPPNIWRAQAK